MANLVTVITPVAPYHADVLSRCCQSVEAQTVQCAHIVIDDDEHKGAGWGRNRGIEQVITPFLIFLDADDWLESDYVEKCLRFYDGQHYIYTDYVNEDGKRFEAHDCATWTQNDWHVITALLPTVWVRAVDGFDETLDALEDTDFYLKLLSHGFCGQRLAEPLFHYGKQGRRSKSVQGTVAYAAIMRTIMARYEGKRMGCCGDDTLVPPTVLGAQPGDWIVRPKWAGTVRVKSDLTGRDYGRIDRYITVSMDPRDAQMWAKDYELLPAIVPPLPPVTIPLQARGVEKSVALPDRDVIDVALAMDLMNPPQYQSPIQPASAEANGHNIVPKPDVARVLQLAGVKPIVQGVMPPISTDPIFVMPEKDYPSYTDFWRLVRLSGFETIQWNEWSLLHDSGTFILVTPERMGAFETSVQPAHIIAWQMEYHGDYTHNYDTFHGEIWASDPQWALEHGAKYVLLGSNPQLYPDDDLPGDAQPYDVTMLGYMTPRRQHIKDQLSNLKWTPDYPGRGEDRHLALTHTRLMLQIHQHETPALAPLRLALAAAYRLPVISESLGYTTPYDGLVQIADYAELPDKVNKALRFKGLSARGKRLHEFLCIENTFRNCVEAALK